MTLTFYLREPLKLETRVKRVIIYLSCLGGTFEKRGNRNKVEPYSPRDFILGSFPLPQTSLSILRIGGTSEKRENRNEIEPNSPRDFILGSFPLPQTSLSVLSFKEQSKAELRKNIRNLSLFE